MFSACIEADNIQILRAYTAYLQQIRFPHSREYIIETLNSYPQITLLLVQAFLAKFDPFAATGADSLVYSTFFGGAGTDSVNDIAVDAAGNEAVAVVTPVYQPPAPVTTTTKPKPEVEAFTANATWIECSSEPSPEK